MTTPQIDAARKRATAVAKRFGDIAVDTFHYVALFAIGLVTVWAAAVAFVHIGTQGNITIEDILLLFIYLELGAMVGIYFKTQHLPVRFLIYIAITALTRMLIGDIQINHQPGPSILFASGAIMLLAISVFIIRYASYKFPSSKAGEDGNQ